MICVVFGVYFVSCFDCVRLAKVDEEAFIEKAKDYVIFALVRTGGSFFFVEKEVVKRESRDVCRCLLCAISLDAFEIR